MDEERLQQELQRMELMRRHTQQRLKKQQAKIDERFRTIEARLNQKYGRPTDNQQRIINATLELLNESGLTNLTLRKLAARLDMQAPALYWHFKNKDVLVDYLAEAILYQEFATLIPRATDEAWQDWLVTTLSRLRRAMLAYRDGGRIVAGAHLDLARTLLQLFETCMQSVVSAGIPLGQANLVIFTAVHFVFGNVIEEQASPDITEVDAMRERSDFENFPYMRQSLQLMAQLHQTDPKFNEFEEALRLIIGYAEEA